MKCGWYAEFEGVCTNDECPYCGDVCPTSEHPGVCKCAEAVPQPKLSAEELDASLRVCASVGFEGCPCAYVEHGGHCDEYVKLQAADMLEKLIKKEGNQNDHPTL